MVLSQNSKGRLGGVEVSDLRFVLKGFRVRTGDPETTDAGAVFAA